MALHLGYESVPPFALQRTDTPDEKVRAAGQHPKCVLRSEPEHLATTGRIVIDTETVLTGIPRAAWDYRLGNRSALDWVLDQHKEKKPKDPTIRAKFDTYRFRDHKERVIDLLARVATVSVETVRIVGAMKGGPR
jgi:predicted helicase